MKLLLPPGIANCSLPMIWPIPLLPILTFASGCHWANVLGSYLQISSNSERPRLFLLSVEDIWHTAPQSLPVGFEQGLEVVEYARLDELKKHLSQRQGGSAFIAEINSLEVAPECWNPQTVTDHIDYQRRGKTAYEQDCVRQANRLAVPAHRAAYEAFMAGASELEIAAAYLRGCDCSESEMPYGIIAGVNEHGAVLHHHNLDKHRPAPRSFLIDAGVAMNGYASDITRTYAYDSGSDFAALIEAMDVAQQELVAGGGIGKSPVDLHVLSHLKVAEILRQFDVLTVSAEEAFDKGITGTFYPHGLGHHLGCNVHDRGSNLANAQGDLLPAPEKYPKLRSGALMVANQIHTVEPGVYFIPALLEKLRQGEYGSKINWSRVADFIPFGGIRIEDKYSCSRRWLIRESNARCISGYQTMKKLQIFTTGGTLDKIYFDALSEFQIGDPVVGSILESMNVGFEFSVDELMRLDSLDMTDQHRQIIQQRVGDSDAEYILIMHGTDGMVETAGWLGEIADKKIIFTGAMQPAAFADTDAVFNIGCAVGAIQVVEDGVYIVMNGQVFAADKVVKNRDGQCFEAIGGL